jgi:hypothetical protein
MFSCTYATTLFTDALLVKHLDAVAIHMRALLLVVHLYATAVFDDTE